jgi:uncharacterized protein YjbI with pentapeptide repeats
MANKEQFQFLTDRGVDAFNKQRKLSTSIPIDLSEADLSGYNLSGINLSGANIRQTKFVGGTLTKAILEVTSAGGADFSGANLDFASLKNANFHGANFRHATALNANFVSAQLTFADLTGANLTGGAFGDAKFENTKVSFSTIGLNDLQGVQRNGLVISDTSPAPENIEPRASRLTFLNPRIDEALPVVSAAVEIVETLPRVNDPSVVSSDQQALIDELLAALIELRSQLAEAREANQKLINENAELLKKVSAQLPLLKRAWETFVLDGAKFASKGPTFMAGFAAGYTYQVLQPATATGIIAV